MPNYEQEMDKAAEELARAEFLVVHEIIAARALRAKATKLRKAAETVIKDRWLEAAHEWPPT